MLRQATACVVDLEEESKYESSMHLVGPNFMGKLFEKKASLSHVPSQKMAQFSIYRYW